MKLKKSYSMWKWIYFLLLWISPQWRSGVGNDGCRSIS